MMSRRRSLSAAENLDQDDATGVAESLQDDFIGLIAIFDRQLAAGSAVGGASCTKIADARAAAQRGLSLARELAELLRTIP
jgi:hypothetical protein